MRTNSSVESDNSVLGRLIPKHPNIYKFIDGIKVHEFARQRELLELESFCPDKQLKRKRNEDVEREAKIKRANDQLLEEKITPGQFLEVFSADQSLLPPSGKCSIVVCYRF